MAITKTKTYTMVCEGPCKKTVTTDQMPLLWTYVLFRMAAYPNKMEPNRKRALVCPDCYVLAQSILQQEGFEFK